jgi:hypothetical protein
MSEPEWPSGRRSTSPDGIVHAVRQHLRRVLAETPTAFPCRFACFIHPRRRQGERGFGVVTLAGESLPLTVAMLESLRRVPTTFEGRATVVVGPADERDSLLPAGDGGSWAVPLPVTRISVQLAERDRERGEGDAQILTPSVEGPQLTLLCADRPEGWPP